MTRVKWDTVGTRFYETGVDRGVLYVPGEPAGVPWTGLISVQESPSGGEAKPHYIDGVKYLNVSSVEEFEATITAFTYPDEFAVCDGTAQARPGFYVTQQRRGSFGFAYRTLVGNDVEGAEHGYKIHLVYNALATPSARVNGTLSESPEAANFEWNLTTKPIALTGYKRSAHFVLDSREIHPLTMKAIEDILYGDEMGVARQPSFEDLLEVLDTPVEFSIVDNEDGTWTISGPDETVAELFGDPTQFSITWPAIAPVAEDTYSITT